MKKLIVSALLSLCLSPAWSLTISVYHTSDVHGWYSARPAAWDKENSTRAIGGFPALAALVKADKNPHILLDSGDTSQGTPEGNLTKGMATVTLMNQLGYSAAAVGNHDYDYTESNLRKMAAASSFTWLGGNIRVRETGAPADYVKPYIIIEKAGKRIAVIGLAGRHTATTTLPANVKHLEFRDEAEEASRWTAEVKKLNPDAIIILAHLGLDADFSGQKVDVSTWTFPGGRSGYGTLRIARAAAPDILLGGHNHTGLAQGYYDKESGTLLAESYWQLTSVSKISLEFDDRTGKLKNAKDELIPLWTDITGEDPAVKETIKGFTAGVDKEMGKVISESSVDLGASPEGLDSDIGNWFTDAMRRQSGVDVAFQNTAGIRSVMWKGPIKLRDIFQVMPFENTLVKLPMTGSQIRNLMADNLRGGRSKLQVSGIKVTFRNTPEGPKDITIEKDGKPVQPGDILSVGTNNYLTTGGTGGKVFIEVGGLDDTLRPLRDMLIKDIRENPVKSAPEGGRITRLE